MSLDYGQNSLIFRGPIVWNGLDKKTHEISKTADFKVAVKSKSSTKALRQISFIKGTLCK